MAFYTKLLILISSYASIFGLYFTITPWSGEKSVGHWIVLGIAAVTSVLHLCQTGFEHFKERPKSFRKPKDIQNYMVQWLSSGGRSVIFSRDLSWAQNGEEAVLLQDKARRNELTICVEASSSYAKKLKELGARVVVYGCNGFVPKSRFTIVDFGRIGARVAIAVKDGETHNIQEFKSDHPELLPVSRTLS